MGAVCNFKVEVLPLSEPPLRSLECFGLAHGCAEAAASKSPKDKEQTLQQPSRSTYRASPGEERWMADELVR
jgi:hypothetical protein